MVLRPFAVCVAFLMLTTGCGDGTKAVGTDPTSLLLASAAEKAVGDSGFNIPADIFVREALYEDVMAVQYEGDPQFLSEADKNALRSKFGDKAGLAFFSDPSVVVDSDGYLLPDRLVVLIGPLFETVEDGQVMAVGVLAGSGLDNAYIGRYPVNLDTGEIGDSPRITMVP